MRKMKMIIGFLPAMFLLCLMGCGSDKKTTPAKPKDPTDDPITITGNCPQNPPINFTSAITVTGLDGALDIRFSPNADSSGVRAVYDVRYGTTNNFKNATELGTNVLRVSNPGGGPGLANGRIDGLENDKTYYVWISAKYEGICTTAFQTKTGTPVPSPEFITGVTAEGFEGIIEVKWPAVEHATSYEVAYSTGDDINAPGVGASTTLDTQYMITGLNNGDVYYIWVRAINANGPSGYSEPVLGMPEEAAEKPGVPGAIALKTGTKRITAEWEAVRGASFYRLYYDDSPSTSSIYEAAVFEDESPVSIAEQSSIRVEPVSGTVRASIDGLVNGREYAVWYEACNSKGCSDATPNKSATPDKKELPNFLANTVLGKATAEYFTSEWKPANPITGQRNQDRHLAGNFDRLTRVKETPLANLFTDGVLWYLNEYLDVPKNVDFVFLNGGFFEGNVSIDGDITVSDVMAAALGNITEKIVLLSIKGSDIKTLFNKAANEGGVAHTGTGTGGTSGWINVSKGVSYTLQYDYFTREISELVVDPTTDVGEYIEKYTNEKWRWEYGKIKPGSLKFNGADFDDSRNYIIATTEYLSGGRDGHTTLATNGTIIDESITIPLWQAVAEYIYDAETVTPAVDGRTRIEGGVPGGLLGVNEGFNKYCSDDSRYDLNWGCIFEPIDIGNEYEVPAGISVGVYDGDTLKTTITTGVLKEMQQGIITTTSNNRDYVAYSITDVLAYLNCTLSPFTVVEYATSDGYLNDKDNRYEATSLANTYIAIGYLNTDDSLNTGNAPRILTNGASTAGSDVIQNAVRITVNPALVDPHPDPDTDNEYEAPAGINVRVLDGGTLKTAITTDVLNKLEQEIVTIGSGSSARNYVAYSITDVLEYLDCELSAFTVVEYATSDGYVNANSNRYDSLANAYIAIGYLNTDDTLNTGGYPRILTDGTSTASVDIIQRTIRVTVNPLGNPEPAYTVQAGISINVYDGATLVDTITSDDLEGLQQRFVTFVTSSARVYVAYPIAEVLEYIDCELSPFTRIKYDASDSFSVSKDNTNFNRAYIAIGYLNADNTLNIGSMPRFIADSLSSAGSDVVNNAARITVNPE